jgi:alpha-ketoglutarate-dependent taurine dioxygenase
MKVSKINGLGNYGVFIDDLHYEDLNDELWEEIGKIHLESLVTIIRNVDIPKDELSKWTNKFGRTRWVYESKMAMKYGVPIQDLFKFVFKNKDKVPKFERDFILNSARTLDVDPQVAKISGMVDNKGRPKGIFAKGELLWHCNEGGQLEFAPGVALLGGEGMTKSATSFVQTVDLFESFTESFQSELKEMITVNNFQPDKINPGLSGEEEITIKVNMCPDKDSEVPLVVKSPHGHVGLHYSTHTIDYIKGMSREESKKVFDYIDKHLYTKENIYDHWYQQDNDLCLFDNSVTLHRRLGSTENRLAYRVQLDYNELLGKEYNPYFQDPYKTIVDDYYKEYNNPW